MNQWFSLLWHSGSLTDGPHWENALLRMWKSGSGRHLCISLGIPEHPSQQNCYSSCPSCLGSYTRLCCKLETKAENSSTARSQVQLRKGSPSNGLPQQLAPWTQTSFLTRFPEAVVISVHSANSYSCYEVLWGSQCPSYTGTTLSLYVCILSLWPSAWTALSDRFTHSFIEKHPFHY